MLKALLLLLEKVYGITRKKSVPLFPYEKRTNTISLPAEVEREILHLVLKGNKSEALKKVVNLTGANLRMSKDYIDNLSSY